MMKHPELGALFLAIVLLLTSIPSSAVVYVKGDSPGPAFDGNSWETAYHTVQEGIDSGGMLNEEVWVARGVYVGCIVLKPNVALYGGFAGAEFNRYQRNARRNETILDGNKSGSVVTVAAGASTGTLIDGFTIRNGTGSQPQGFSSLCGGGIMGLGVAVISNNRIQGNTATNGGGIYGGGTITSNIIRDNTAVTGGGVLGGSTVANNVVYGNWANTDSGISGAGEIVNNTVVGNGCVSGGAVKSTTIINNIVAFNSSGVRVDDGLFISGIKSNCVFGNSAFNYKIVTRATTSGNFSVDPGLASTEYGDLHIRPDSPCRDAGDDTVVQPDWLDVDGYARIQGAHVDVGADESYGGELSFTPRIVRVRTDGSDENDGSSWELAKRTVQTSIDAISAQGGGEVWVKAGTYGERISLAPYARIYGGFVGDEMSRDQRDWTAHETILDGGQAGSVVMATTGCGYRLSALDGFTIRNGIGVLVGSDRCGGGIYCENSAPEISNNLITANTALLGGGIYCKSAACLISHNTITGNSASYGGGAAVYSSSILLDHNTISANIASSNGAGVFTSTDTSVVSANRVTGNSAGGSGGGVYCAQAEYTAFTVVSDSVVVGNTAAIQGGGIACGPSSYTAVTNNTVIGNTAPQGGGVALDGRGASVANNIIAWCSSGIHQTGSGNVTERSNCLYGNPVNYTGLTGSSLDILYQDPLLVDRAGGDYHLLPNSPCVNRGYRLASGMPPYDMDGESRCYGNNLDVGADEYWPSTLSILYTKRAADGAIVSGGGAIVSAVFPDYFYVETENRTTGMMVRREEHGLSAGVRVSVTGMLGTNSCGERFIEASSVVTEESASVRPLGFRTRNLGGPDVFYNALTGVGQRGVKEYQLVRSGDTWVRTLRDAIGLNNIGLLVRVWGKVTYVGDTFFYLDDGARMEDGMHTDNGSSCTGVRVAAEGRPLPELDWLVRVTGVSSCYKSGSDLFRLLRAVEISPVEQ